MFDKYFKRLSSIRIPRIIKIPPAGRARRTQKGISSMYQKIKRILALLAVIIIVLLYLATLVLSFFHSEQAKDLLMISIVATVVLPVLLYIYLWLFRLFKGGDDQEP